MNVGWEMELISAFRQNDVETAMGVINHMPVSGIGLARIVLDVYKDETVRWMLSMIREYGTNEVEVIISVNALTGLGIKWPELDVIKRSMHADEIND